jgi:hypothetical protein
MKRERNTYQYIPLPELLSPNTQQRVAALNINHICLSVPVTRDASLPSRTDPYRGLYWTQISFRYAVWRLAALRLATPVSLVPLMSLNS